MFSPVRKMKGRQPRWMSRIMQHHIKPVAEDLGIPLEIGTLYATATSCCARMATIQKLSRISRSLRLTTSTANIYDAAVSEEKREAHRGVLRLVTRTATRTGDGNGRMTSA